MLHLSGRDAARLAEVAAEVRAKGAQASETLLDVTDRAGMEAWVLGCPELDLVIANAGISARPGNANRENGERLRAVFATDLDGVFNTVLPAMERQTKRVVIIGSIAGLIALPTSPAYSAAKAALDFWVRAAGPAGIYPHGNDREKPVPHAGADGCRPGSQTYHRRDRGGAEIYYLSLMVGGPCAARQYAAEIDVCPRTRKADMSSILHCKF
jgi:hypothetical protein